MNKALAAFFQERPDFWKRETTSAWKYMKPDPPQPESILKIEQALGVKLPESFVHFFQNHNGGYPIFASIA